MSDQIQLSSPRIAQLEKELVAGQQDALAAFWQEIKDYGTPLIEPIDGDSEHYLATFLWRDTGAIKNVVIFAGPAGWDHPEKNQMTHLLDSDVWYKVYRVGNNLRTTYLLSPNDPLTDLAYGDADFGARIIPDPLNPHQFIYPKDPENPEDKELVTSIIELPAAPTQPWIISQLGISKGKVEMFRISSNVLDNDRRVWVYTPPNYDAQGEPYHLLLVFDGMAYIDLVPTPIILDNLIAAGKIPPMVAVIPDSLDQETRNRELPCYQPFVDFLKQELMPWIHEHYNVTSDPAQSIVAGSSYGGLASAFVGLHLSEIFGNVLSQSGSFWWNRDPEYHLPSEWLIQQYISSPHLSLRFYLEVGLQEKTGSIDMISCNRHFRDILQLKGYEIQYSEFNGGHDYTCWRGSFADGLLALIGQP